AAGDLVVAQADGELAVIERVPAGAGLDAGEQRPDTGSALIGHGAEGVLVVDVLFVLGADAPLGLRLAAAGHGFDQIGARLDEWRRFGAGHGCSRGCLWRRKAGAGSGRTI